MHFVWVDETTLRDVRVQADANPPPTVFGYCTDVEEDYKAMGTLPEEPHRLNEGRAVLTTEKTETTERFFSYSVPTVLLPVRILFS